jgi:hypothetical protein
MHARHRWSNAGLALAVLGGVASVSAQPQTTAPAAAEPQPVPAAADRVARDRPTDPGQEKARGGAAQRLGRQYPAPLLASPPQRREEPRVYVAVVSPRDSGIHRKVGRRGLQRGFGGDAGDNGMADTVEPPAFDRAP